MPLLMTFTLTVWIMVKIDNGLEMSLAKQYWATPEKKKRNKEG